MEDDRRSINHRGNNTIAVNDASRKQIDRLVLPLPSMPPLLLYIHGSTLPEVKCMGGVGDGPITMMMITASTDARGCCQYREKLLLILFLIIIIIVVT